MVVSDGPVIGVNRRAGQLLRWSIVVWLCGWVLASSAMMPPQPSVPPHSQGTTFKISDGVWITAKHVALDCRSMAIGENQMLPVDEVMTHPTADLALLITPVDESVSSLEMTKGSPQPDDLSVLYGYPQSVAIDLKQRFIGSRTQRFRLSSRRSVSQNVSVWSEIARYPTGNERSLKGASGAPVLAYDGRLVGVHIASVPRRGRTLSIHPELLNEFLAEQKVSPAQSSAAVQPMSQSAPMWLINGAELRAFGTIAKALCWF